MVQDRWLQQKMKLLLGYNLKIVIQWVRWTFGGVSLRGGGGVWLVQGGGEDFLLSSK